MAGAATTHKFNRATTGMRDMCGVKLSLPDARLFHSTAGFSLIVRRLVDWEFVKLQTSARMEILRLRATGSSSMNTARVLAKNFKMLQHRTVYCKNLHFRLCSSQNITYKFLCFTLWIPKIHRKHSSCLNSECQASSIFKRIAKNVIHYLDILIGINISNTQCKYKKWGCTSDSNQVPAKFQCSQWNPWYPADTVGLLRLSQEHTACEPAQLSGRYQNATQYVPVDCLPKKIDKMAAIPHTLHL